MLRRNAMLTLVAGLAASATTRAANTQRQSDVVLASGATIHRFTATADDAVDFTVVRFDAARCTLRIINQPDRSTATSLAEAMEKSGAIAGVNGGFFTPSFEPLGLCISQGKRTGNWQRSSLLGGVVMVKKGRPMLLWRDEFQDSPGITELVQAGPRLVNNGKPVSGLESRSQRSRTFIATDNAGHWLLGICEYTSLAMLAQLLSTPGLVPGFTVVRALNFDGGKSTGLWARTATGEVISEAEFTRVKNFVSIVPRMSS